MRCGSHFSSQSALVVRTSRHATKSLSIRARNMTRRPNNGAVAPNGSFDGLLVLRRITWRIISTGRGDVSDKEGRGEAIENVSFGNQDLRRSQPSHDGPQHKQPSDDHIGPRCFHASDGAALGNRHRRQLGRE